MLAPELHLGKIHAPEYYHREYANDVRNQPPEQSNLCQRVALVALPFLSLHKSLSFPISLAMGSLRSFTCITQLMTVIKSGKSSEIPYHLLQTAISITALTGTIFAHPLGMLITTTHDLITEITHLLHQLEKGDSEKAFQSCANILNNALYLAMFLNGGLEIAIASLAMQIILGLNQSKGEFDKGNYLEALGHVLMAGVRGNQMYGQVQTIQLQRKTLEIESRKLHEVAKSSNEVTAPNNTSKLLVNETPKERALLSQEALQVSYDQELLDILTKYANNPDKIPTLHYAVKMSDERAVTVLLERGMDINKSCSLGCPLEIAFKLNNISMCQLLIQKNAQMSDKLVDLAITNRSKEGLNLLLQSGFKLSMVHSSYIAKAISSHFNEGFEIFIQAGLDITNNSFFVETAIKNNNEHILKMCVNRGFKLSLMHNGGQVLFNAIKDTNIESSLICFLIKNEISCDYSKMHEGVRPNTNKIEPLLLIEANAEAYPLITVAVDRGDIDIISLLLNHGVKCDFPFSPSITFTTDDKHGPTYNDELNPFIWSAHGRHRNQSTNTKVAILNGSLSCNPLYRAVILNRADIAELLIRHGSKIIFETNRDFRGVLDIDPKDAESWHNLLYFQEYITIQPPQPIPTKSTHLTTTRHRQPVPQAQKILQHKSYVDGVTDLIKKLDDLKERNLESTKQGVLLMTAISNKNAALVKLLLDNGHPINFRGDSLKTPIKLAVELGNRDVITQLLSHGADWDGV